MHDSDTTAGTRGIRVANVAWPEVAARLEAGATALLPIGAASKAHGRHLPLATDRIQADWLAARLVEQRPVVAWPTLGYGHYPAFVDYPGSVSLSAETFSAVVRDIVVGMARAGARRVVLLNTGISTIRPLQQVLANTEVPVELLNVYAGPAFVRVEAGIRSQAFGGHADEIETSIMLAIAPGRVNMERAETSPGEISPGMFNRSDPDAANYSPAGVNGDPTRATREKGQRLVAAMLEDALAVLGRFPGHSD